jgi:hypothetical protein
MPSSSGDKILEVFFSYSHKDEALCDELNAHLAALKRQNAIKNWTDRRITAGDEWRDEIDKHLDSADLILLLVSSDFLNSDFCYLIETSRALLRHESGDARVIPVLITTRDKIDNARSVRIAAMSLEEAQIFLSRLIEEAHDRASFDGLDHALIIETAERNPLVMQWIVAQIDEAQRPRDVLAELRQGESDAAHRVFDRSFDLEQLGDDGRAACWPCRSSRRAHRAKPWPKSRASAMT